MDVEINKIMLEKRITSLQFELENSLEDKNILINRIETLEMELLLSQKKINEWKDVESSYRQNEKALKERISELEDKLITTRENKGKELVSDVNKFYGEGLYDREILTKKNEEISRLNEVIKSNRTKVTDANNEISLEKIKHIKNVQVIEAKHEELIQEKDREIERLRV